MRKYYIMGLNKYLNKFGCPRIDRMNIQTYLDTQQIHKQICSDKIKKYACEWYLWAILLQYCNILVFVFIPASATQSSAYKRISVFKCFYIDPLKVQELTLVCDDLEQQPFSNS